MAAPREVWVDAALKAAWEAAAAEAVAVPGASGSALAATVQCAARLAQALAFETALPLDAVTGGGAAGGGAAGGSMQSGGMKGDGVVGRSAVAGGAAFSVAANSSVAAAWRLFILTDSPALAALVGRLPSLRGHVISQGDAINGAPNDKSAVGSTDAAGLLSAADSGRRLDDSSYLGVPSLTDVSLAIDLWMLGAADHVRCTTVSLRSPLRPALLPHPPHSSKPLYAQPPTPDSTTARRLTGDRRFGLDAHHVCHPLDRAQRPSSLVEQPHRIHRQQGQWCATRQQIGNKMGDSPLALLDSIFVHHTITD